MKKTSEEIRTTSSYTCLAEIYDDIMEHVNYDLWADFSQEITHRYRIAGMHLLEIACGTGTLAKHMHTKGYQVTCIDLNHAMLKVAREKLPRRVQLLQASMHQLPLRAVSYDIILCLYDSINYLTQPELIARFLADAVTLLNPNGVLLFDVCTEHNSKTYFANSKDSDTGKNYYYERISKYRTHTRIQENNFTIYLKNGPHMITYHEEHRQRIYPLSDIEKLIKKNGSFTYEMFDGFTFKKPHKYSDRVHFALRLK